MQFATPDTSTPVNYFTYFEATAEERRTLLHYLEFLTADGAYEQVASDDRFPPLGRLALVGVRYLRRRLR